MTPEKYFLLINHRANLKTCFLENKARQILCAYQRVRNVDFSENLACFTFLKHPACRCEMSKYENQLYHRYEIMIKCWYENSNNRPSFEKLVDELELLLDELTSQVC